MPRLPILARVGHHAYHFKMPAERVLGSLGIKIEAAKRLIAQFPALETVHSNEPSLFNVARIGDAELARQVSPADMEFRAGDNLKNPSPGDFLRILKRRNPRIVDPGEEIPLRAVDQIMGSGYTIKMVNGLDTRDIPEIIAFWNCCVPQTIGRALPFIEIKVTSYGADLHFCGIAPSSTAMFAGLKYNGELIMGHENAFPATAA